MLLGIVGFIGSGKGTVGDILEKDYGFIKDSFAAPLKDATARIFGWDRALLEGDTEQSRTWREQADEFWSDKFGYEFTPRLALQLMGTESCRDVFHRDIWVISLLHRNRLYFETGQHVVVTDVRFKNEVNLIRGAGGKIIYVQRGPVPVWYELAKKANAGDTVALEGMNQYKIHVSEWDWIGSEVDYTIYNDSTLEQLSELVGVVVENI